MTSIYNLSFKPSGATSVVIATTLSDRQSPEANEIAERVTAKRNGVTSVTEEKIESDLKRVNSLPIPRKKERGTAEKVVAFGTTIEKKKTNPGKEDIEKIVN